MNPSIVNGRQGGAEREPGVQAVVFDWAGTTVDFGCFAPAVSMVQAFRARGIVLTMEEARGPMGLEKKDHIRALLSRPVVKARWREKGNGDPTEADVEQIYAELETRLLDAVRQHAALVPGVIELTGALRGRGIAIGSTTGYSRSIMDVLVPEAARRGYRPDAVICPSDVPAGRPFPWMCYQNAMRLNAYPLSRMVKVGDTPADMREGVNAGMWTIGVVQCGNEIGLSLDDLAAIPPEVLASRRERAALRLLGSGAHYVADDLEECAARIRRIEQRVLRGDMPSREDAR